MKKIDEQYHQKYSKIIIRIRYVFEIIYSYIISLVDLAIIFFIAVSK